MDKKLLYKIAVTKIPNVGAVTAKNLISYCGGVEEVFKSSRSKLLKIPGVGTKTIDSILSKMALNTAEQELNFIQEHDIQVLFYLDEKYPHRLKNYLDSPAILYYKGNANLNHDRIVGIVGTRKPTPEGQLICESLVEGLRKYDVLVISGLAYGIDACAHQSCVARQIPNIGVLGHGLKRIYPAVHKKLAQSMVQHGGLLTEFGSDKGPDREHFPMRNRIIAGMCDALIVVQTARKGGSMISADMANRYSKDVFAVPGRLNDEMYKGCNHLIKTHKASLLESAEDIAYVMRWDETRKVISKQIVMPILEPQEKMIVDLLKENSEIDIDNLTHASQLSSSEMATLLLGLEFKGIIKTLPGKRYILVAQ